ncbi:MAG TPA: TolC family protein [Candidatus Acidoferrum sp.]|nr:TolC family protein [Candidatus Acidoferrum sp.]
MRFWLFIPAIVLLTGCVHYQPQPVSATAAAAQWDSRQLADPGVRKLIEQETGRPTTTWPPAKWDLNTLTFAAFYFHPDLEVARAQWLVAVAGEKTAGARPNPSVSLNPSYDSQIPGNYSPWIVPLSFDVPIETAGKRGKRIAEAEHLAEAARWNLVGAVWQVRSQIRAALLNLYSSRETEALLSQQEMAQSNVVRLLEGQLVAGSASEFEATQARTALETTQLARQDAIGKLNQAQVELGHALGLPTHALNGASFSFAGFDEFPEELTRPEVRRAALLNRADVRGALAEYAASQSALQLEIANQYPDLHLGPGYAWNNGNAGDSQWSLGLTVTLPLLNHNQGPVAEAEAKRTQSAAHFLTVQANAIAEIESALAGYNAALQQVSTAKALLDNSQKRLNSFRVQQKLGELEPQAVATAEVEFATGAQNRLTALIQAQQALGRLEDAVQSPLTLSPAVLDAAENNRSQAFK